MIALHLCAPNDANGNPQRCFAILNSEGGIFRVLDEGYAGEALLDGIRGNFQLFTAAHRINVSADEYKRWLSLDPTGSNDL